MILSALVMAVLVPEAAVHPGVVRGAVVRALPVLAAGAAGHAEKKTCFACHNQAHPMAAFGAAHERGFALPDDLLTGQTGHVHEFLDSNKDKFRAGQGTGGQVDTAGWALFTLERGGQKPDDVTEAVVEYLLKKDAAKDRWPSTSNRPPTEASIFTANYVAVRGVQKWGTVEQKERVAKRLDSVKAWAAKTPAKDTEDRVYRLLLLNALNGDAEVIRSAADELLKDQHDDGGWGQLPKMDSDAYATGTVLFALHETGRLAATENAYRRGVAFLIRTQRADGTWLLKSRSKPFQPYYESGFPHKNDQFISSSATAFAVVALLPAVPVQATK